MTANTIRPALVIVDVQKGIDDPAWGRRNNPNAETVLAALLAYWRRRALPRFHVRHDSTEDDSPYRPDRPGNEFKPEVAPVEDEAVVIKTTNSAFIGTDLADRLTASGCDAVFYGGVLTNNSLEATVRMSGNLGFRSFVVADACWAVDTIDLRGRTWPAEDVHALSLANLDGEYATVIKSEDILADTAEQPHRPSPS